jgi:hypothetical protein
MNADLQDKNLKSSRSQSRKSEYAMFNVDSVFGLLKSVFSAVICVPLKAIQ